MNTSLPLTTVIKRALVASNKSPSAFDFGACYNDKYGTYSRRVKLKHCVNIFSERQVRKAELAVERAVRRNDPTITQVKCTVIPSDFMRGDVYVHISTKPRG